MEYMKGEAFKKMIPGMLSQTGEHTAGLQKEQSKRFEGKQLIRAAGARRAEGAERAVAARRRGDIFESDVRAARGASGTAFDEGSVERLADVGEVTDYNVLAALFESETEARGLEFKAKTKQYEAKASKRGRYIKTALSGATGVYGSYIDTKGAT